MSLVSLALGNSLVPRKGQLRSCIFLGSQYSHELSRSYRCRYYTTSKLLKQPWRSALCRRVAITIYIDHLESGFERHNVWEGHLLNKWGGGCLLFSLGWGEVCLRQGLSQAEQRIVLPENQSCSSWSIVGWNQTLYSFAYWHLSQLCVKQISVW